MFKQAAASISLIALAFSLPGFAQGSPSGAELTIAKKPAPLKRMEMEIDFEVLPEGHQVMKKAVMRMHVGLIVKNYRIEAVETYTDHLIRGHNTHSPISSGCGREKGEWVLCPQIMLYMST